MDNNGYDNSCKIDDLIDLESNMDYDTQEKNLTDDILGKHWLTSDHMTNINNLMLHAGYSLSGFQDTMLAPVLKKDGAWHIPADGFKSQRSPSTNIHYNSQKHWVTSFQSEDGEFYLLDSDLMKDIDLCFNDSSKIQLAQIYGYQKNKAKD